MTTKKTFEEQAADAQREMDQWTDVKKKAVQLQGQMPAEAAEQSGGHDESREPERKRKTA